MFLGSFGHILLPETLSTSVLTLMIVFRCYIKRFPDGVKMDEWKYNKSEIGKQCLKWKIDKISFFIGPIIHIVNVKGFLSNGLNFFYLSSVFRNWSSPASIISNWELKSLLKANNDLVAMIVEGASAWESASRHVIGYSLMEDWALPWHSWRSVMII